MHLWDIPDSTLGTEDTGQRSPGAGEAGTAEAAGRSPGLNELSYNPTVNSRTLSSPKKSLLLDVTL